MQVLAMFYDHLDQLKFQFHLYAQFSPAEEEHAHTMEFDALTINTFGAYDYFQQHSQLLGSVNFVD